MSWDGPKISVIVPTYNRADLVGGCIEAVLSQRIENFELIVVSDGSTDETEGVVKGYRDPRMLFLTKENAGQASARNLGILESTGKYISLCDDDDRFYPDHLITLSNFLDTRPDVGLAYSDSFWNYEDGHKKSEVKYSQDFDKKSLENYNYITPLNVLFRRSCLEKRNLFNEDLALKGLEDWDFFLRLSDDYAFWHINKVTSEYNVHEANSFQADSGYDYNRAFLLIRTQRFEYLVSRFGPSLFNHVDHMYPFHLIQCYLNNGKFEQALETAVKLYDLYKKYSHKNNQAPHTELLIFFALGISNFALGSEEKAQLLLKNIEKSPSYGLMEEEFIRFVSRYIGMTPNVGLRALLTSCF